MEMEKENSSRGTTTTTPRSKPAEQSPVYGYLLVIKEKDGDFSHIFAVDKKVVDIGRGSRNDIRLNARMFSRLHATITITEEEETLRVSVGVCNMQ